MPIFSASIASCLCIAAICSGLGIMGICPPWGGGGACIAPVLFYVGSCGIEWLAVSELNTITNCRLVRLNK